MVAGFEGGEEGAEGGEVEFGQFGGVVAEYDLGWLPGRLVEQVEDGVGVDVVEHRAVQGGRGFVRRVGFVAHVGVEAEVETAAVAEKHVRRGHAVQRQDGVAGGGHVEPGDLGGAGALGGVEVGLEADVDGVGGGGGVGSRSVGQGEPVGGDDDAPVAADELEQLGLARVGVGVGQGGEVGVFICDWRGEHIEDHVEESDAKHCQDRPCSGARPADLAAAAGEVGVRDAVRGCVRGCVRGGHAAMLHRVGPVRVEVHSLALGAGWGGGQRPALAARKQGTRQNS